MFVADAGMKGVFVTMVRPGRTVFVVNEFVPEIVDPETVADGEHPGTVGVIELHVEVVVEILFTSESYKQIVCIVNLPTGNHRQVFTEGNGELCS